MQFSALQRGDLFSFLNGEYTYKKIADTVAMPMCSRRDDLVDVKPEAEVLRIKPSLYSRHEEEEMPDFEGLTWELECQIAEMRKE